MWMLSADRARAGASDVHLGSQRTCLAGAWSFAANVAGRSKSLPEQTAALQSFHAGSLQAGT